MSAYFSVKPLNNIPIDLSDAALDENAVLALKGSSFHWARYLLGTTHANRATRLYRFCRYIDDVADEAVSIATAKSGLLQLSHDIATGQSNNAITQDALQLMQECSIAPELMQALIDGVTLDLEPVAMCSMDELLRYCYHVAGTVGLMMCKVLEVTDKCAYPFAIDLGIAMQLTNISRDVADDAKLGRCYLPATMIGKFTTADLLNPQAEQKAILQQCLKDILMLADTYYASGKEGLPFIGLRPRCSIAVASSVYREIGKVLNKRQHQYWQGRAIVSKKTKCVVTLQTLFKTCLKRDFWRNTCIHNAQLHSALIGLPMVNSLAAINPLPSNYVDDE